MEWRHDAMFTSAELIRILTLPGQSPRIRTVATVGRMEVKPNVGNVIAREVTFSLDVRHSDAEIIEQFCEACFREFETIASEHGTTVACHKWMDEPPVAMDSMLNEAAEDILKSQGISYKRMTSGAGHDSQILEPIVQQDYYSYQALGGISHSPAEFTHTDDLQRGVRLLIDLLYKLAY